MLLLIPLLPFLGFLVNAFLGRRLPKSVSGGVACLAIIGSFVGLGAVGVDRRVGRDALFAEATAFNWMASGDLQMPLQLRLDHLSSLMILVDHRHRLADSHLLDRLHARGDATANTRATSPT